MLTIRLQRFFGIVSLFLVIKVVTALILTLSDGKIGLIPVVVWTLSLVSLFISWRKQGCTYLLFTISVLFITIVLDLSRSNHYSLLVLCYTITAISIAWNLPEKLFMDFLAFVFFLVYFFAGINKLNLGFISGSLILSQSIRLSETLNHFSTILSLSLVVISISTVVFEILLSVAIITNKVSAFFLVFGALFHIAIILLMGGESPIITMELFIYNSFCLIVLTGLFKRNSTILFVVVWDVECSFCKTTIFFLEKCDLWTRIEFVPNDNYLRMKELGVIPEESLKAIQVVNCETTVVHSGYDGFRCLSLILPLFTILFPILKFRPVEAVGQKMYSFVAARRSCRI